jgi:hypothetical protein
MLEVGPQLLDHGKGSDPNHSGLPALDAA